MHVYFDTSALLKLVVDEPGRDVVTALLDVATTATTARVTSVECRAALAAIRRAGRLTAEHYALACGAVSSVGELFQVVDLDAPLAAEAGDLAERHALRGFDAVHLASGLTVRHPARPQVFATWDRRLHRAAFDAGLSPAPAVL